jgi:hypothetical protein
VLDEIVAHHGEALGLDTRAAEVALGEVVEHVHGVQRELLDRRRMVLRRAVAVDVLTDSPDRIVGDVEDLQLFVGDCEVARRRGVVALRLRHHRALEQDERGLRAQTSRHLVTVVHAEGAVEGRDGVVIGALRDRRAAVRGSFGIGRAARGRSQKKDRPRARPQRAKPASAAPAAG